MRKLSVEELAAIAQLAAIAAEDREVEIAQNFCAIRLGPELPLIHRVLFC